MQRTQFSIDIHPYLERKRAHKMLGMLYFLGKSERKVLKAFGT